MNRIHKYLHEYDFPYHDYLSKFENELIKNYNLIKNNRLVVSNDVGLNIDHELNKNLLPKIDNLIKANYLTTPQVQLFPLRYYVQDNNTNNTPKGFGYHNHSSLLGNLNIIFYLNPSIQGGELGYFEFPNVPLTIKPKKDKIYVMPHWLYHTALPQRDNKVRISFNWNYTGTNRAIHKLTGDVW